MSYQIRYTDAKMIKQAIVRRKKNVKLMAVVCLILLLAGLLRIDSVQDVLIPGDTDVTKAAFSSFTQELKDGKGLGDAIAVFCREVIESDILE